MNKSKSLILMLVCGLCATFLTTSCLNTDDDNNNSSALSRTDSITSMEHAAGSYTGKILYNVPATSTTTASRDSVSCTWRVSSDYLTYGKLTVYDLPVSALAPYLQSTGSATSAKEVLAAAPTQSLEMYILPYTISAGTSAYYYMYALYKDGTLKFSVDYDGSSHDVEIEFASYLYDSSYSSYLYSIAAKYGSLMQGNILINSITVDSRKFTAQTYFYFHN